MKRITMVMLAALVGAGMVAVSVRAGDEGAKPAVEKEKAPKPELQDVSVTGIISKVEEKKGEKSVVKYVLTDAQGQKMTLQNSKEGVNLDEYLDVSVKVTGKGLMTKKNDKEVVVIKKVLSVEKAADAGAAAPAAPGDAGADAGDNKEGAGDKE